MTSEKDQQLLELLGALCNGALDPGQAARLTEMLRTDANARQLYSDYLDVHVTLVDHAKRSLNAGSLLPASLPTQRASVPKRGWGWTTASAAAFTLGMATLLLIALTLKFDRGAEEVARKKAPTDEVASKDATHSNIAVPPPPIRSKSDPLYIAQMTNLTDDVSWGERAASQEFLLRVRRGDRIEIRSGLVQIDYFSGAQIILQGPCAFIPTGDNSGRLERGELTGEVSKGDFVLTTPTAKVVDLGTAFGVSVDGLAKTEVCVFDGEVRVIGGLRGHHDSSMLLREGMAARVVDGGHVTEVLGIDVGRFARALPEAPEIDSAGEVSLVDLLSGSFAGNTRLAGVIAPDTGESDRHAWLREDGPGYCVNNGYRLTSWHPFVDGVFIPSESGIGTQLDSAGRQVDLPPSTGRTWGPIWSRRRLPSVLPSSAIEDYWGTDTLEGVISRLSQCTTGMIGIHSNVGVTFDLAAIRSHWQRNPTGFRAIVSNLDNSMRRMPEWAAKVKLTADLRIFVDGHLRASRYDFGRKDGEVEIATTLTQEDRFLTIVCTDAAQNAEAGHDAYDHVVLIDPVLDLSQPSIDTP